MWTSCRGFWDMFMSWPSYLSRIWLPLTTSLAPHYSCTSPMDCISHHSLHLRRTHSHPPLHQSHSCHQSLICPDCLTTPAPHSHTHTHISSTLPCKHCEVLFSPVWYFQAVSPECVSLDCLYDSDHLLPAFWPCLPFDILSVCCLPQPLHCPCCWFCLAFVTPVTVSEPCLFDLLLFINKAAFGSNYTASSIQKTSPNSDPAALSRLPSPTMDAIDQLLHLCHGGLSIEEYVHQFCELSYQVLLYNEFLFKDLFHFGLNRHIKSLFNKSLFPGGVFNGSLRGLMDYALLYAGSSFTVGVAEEEGDTTSLTKMADAPEGTHKMAEATTHHQKPESAHVMPTKPGSAHVMPTKPGSAHVMPAKPGSALVVPAKPGSALVVPAKPGSALVVPAKPGSALVVPAKPGSVLVVPAKPGSVLVVPAMPESPAKMATTPADAPLWPGLIASVLDPPLVLVRAAGISRARSVPGARRVRSRGRSVPGARRVRSRARSVPGARRVRSRARSVPGARRGRSVSGAHRVRLSRAPAGPVRLSRAPAGPVQLTFVYAGPAQLTFVSAGPAQLTFSAGSVQFSAFRAPPRLSASRAPPRGCGLPQGNCFGGATCLPTHGVPRSARAARVPWSIMAARGPGSSMAT